MDRILIGTLMALSLQLAACAEGGGKLGDGCPPKDPCGNGQIEAGEECDPGNGRLNPPLPMRLGNMSCQSMVGMTGQLLCNCDCKYDLSMCMGQDVSVGANGGN